MFGFVVGLYSILISQKIFEKYNNTKKSFDKNDI